MRVWQQNTQQKIPSYRRIFYVVCLFYFLQFVIPSPAEAACLPSYPGPGGSNSEMSPAGRGSIYCDVYLTAGDIVNVRITRIANGNARYYLRLYQITTNTMVDQKLISFNNVATRVLTAPAAGYYHIVWDYVDRTNRRYRLQTTVPINTPPGTDQGLDLTQNATQTLSQVGFDMSSNLVERRVQSLGSGHVRAAGSPFQAALNSDHKNIQGKAAGEARKAEYGGWFDVDYAEFGSGENNPDFDGHQVALAAGLDYAASKKITYGAALTLESGEVRTRSNIGTALESQRTAFGISPYAVYHVTNIFSVTAQGNLSYGDNEVTSNSQSLEEETLRWSLGLQADLRKRWGQIGLLLGVGMNYMQEESLSQSGTIRLAASSDTKAESGRLNFLIKPSYQFKLSNGAYFEPAILSEYRYDYVMADQTQQTGHIIQHSDRRDLRLGLGARYQHSDDFGVNVEGSHLFWQSDYSETRFHARAELKF